jgi:hypothetical protein
MISHAGGITLETFTRLQSATPASRMARCIAARWVSWVPVPVVKKRRRGTTTSGAACSSSLAATLAGRVVVRLFARAGIVSSP